jgi:hypothetical protein
MKNRNDLAGIHGLNHHRAELAFQTNVKWFTNESPDFCSLPTVQISANRTSVVKIAAAMRENQLDSTSFESTLLHPVRTMFG